MLTIPFPSIFTQHLPETTAFEFFTKKNREEFEQLATNYQTQKEHIRTIRHQLWREVSLSPGNLMPPEALAMKINYVVFLRVKSDFAFKGSTQGNFHFEISLNFELTHLT
ncbi:hypothetical protein Y032_0345g3125 [Ancylostoma ceylanicum]|nr:hypothetical protein Y032_0345g3125 [Ancylostoma ceylanicum]